MATKYSAPFAGEARTIPTPDGGQLHTVSAGSGTPIVFAHGYAVDLDEWNLIGAALVERGYRVIAFDQRGHGRSTIGRDGMGSVAMSRDYGTVLEEYDVTDGVLVAHSMGGFLGIRFLVENPELVRQRLKALVLVATFAGDVNRKNPQNRVQIPMIRSGVMARIAASKRLGPPFAKSLLGDDKDPDMAQAFLEVFRQQHLPATIPVLEAMVRESRYDRLGEISLPCTIAVGTKDKTTPPFHTDELHRGIAGSRLVRIPGKGHMVNWEAADLLVEEIVALAG